MKPKLNYYKKIKKAPILGSNQNDFVFECQQYQDATVEEEGEMDEEEQIYKYNMKFNCIERLIHYHYVEISIKNFKWCLWIFQEQGFF